MARLANRRETIRHEALRLFVERGADAVSVRDIAEACGMQKPNLYNYYESKEALVSELFHHGYAAYGETLHEIATVDAPFKTRLDRMVRTICRLHDEDTMRFRFLVMTQHDYLRHVASDDRNPVDVICRAVAAAMQTGEIPVRDPLLMGAAVIGLIVQPATFLLYGRIEGGLLERADEIVATCWRALS